MSHTYMIFNFVYSEVYSSKGDKTGRDSLFYFSFIDNIRLVEKRTQLNEVRKTTQTEVSNKGLIALGLIQNLSPW